MMRNSHINQQITDASFFDCLRKTAEMLHFIGRQRQSQLDLESRVGIDWVMGKSIIALALLTFLHMKCAIYKWKGTVGDG